MKYKGQVAIGLAIGCGILTSFAYVNPYSGEILLSELILQLSGSRGEFALGTSMPELVTLIMRMIPVYIFEVYFGTALYRHFCTASIFVFSRYPNRLYWYFREVFSIALAVVLYQLIVLLTVILTTIFRYQLQIDMAGIFLFIYHFLIYSVWIYSMTLSVNLLAIRFGSSTSFLAVVGMQIICITLLGATDTILKYFDNTFLPRILLNLNPIAHLILGWHSSYIKPMNQVLNSPYQGLDFNGSLLFFIFFCTVILLLGANIIKKHDLLISDLEKEGL